MGLKMLKLYDRIVKNPDIVVGLKKNMDEAG